jgi:hypothetical protein
MNKILFKINVHFRKKLRKEYELRQQCHYIFIILHVATRPSRKWEDGIRMDLGEIGLGGGGGLDSTNSGQGPVAGWLL